MKLSLIYLSLLHYLLVNPTIKINLLVENPWEIWRGKCVPPNVCVIQRWNGKLSCEMTFEKLYQCLCLNIWHPRRLRAKLIRYCSLSPTPRYPAPGEGVRGRGRGRGRGREWARQRDGERERERESEGEREGGGGKMRKKERKTIQGLISSQIWKILKTRD